MRAQGMRAQVAAVVDSGYGCQGLTRWAQSWQRWQEIRDVDEGFGLRLVCHSAPAT